MLRNEISLAVYARVHLARSQWADGYANLVRQQMHNHSGVHYSHNFVSCLHLRFAKDI